MTLLCNNPPQNLVAETTTCYCAILWLTRLSQVVLLLCLVLAGAAVVWVSTRLECVLLT